MVGAYKKATLAHERLAALAPDNIKHQRDFATAIERVAAASSALAETQAALAYYRSALAVRERIMTAYPDNVSFQRAYVLTLSQIAQILCLTGERTQGQREYLRAFAMVEKYVAASPDDPLLEGDLAIGLYLLAFYLDDEPAPRVERAREIVRRLESQGKLAPDRKAQVAVLEQLLTDKPK
jgi:tetratricopeptide (TPR) repeat protein